MQLLPKKLKMKIKLDNKKIETIRSQNYNQDNGIVGISQPTELGESIRELNKDKIDPVTRMTTIDLNTRLNGHMERNAVLAIDGLVSLKMMPVSCLGLTRQLKRLNVSLNGEGRKEVVELVGGKRGDDIAKGGGGIVDGMKKFFSGKQ